MPSAKQIHKQFCSLFFPFRGNYFWLFTITHVVVGAVGTCCCFKKTCGWEATSLPVSFQCEISGYPLPKEPRLHGAHCLEGAPQGSPACLLLSDRNERRPPGPWACNSCDNRKAGPLAHGSQHEAVGQGWALRTSSPMPLDGLDEFTQHRGGSKCVVCGGLLQIPDFPNPAPALF